MTTKTSENIKLKIERIIKAPRERVSKRGPIRNKSNNGSCREKAGDVTCPSAKCDPRVGGRYRIQTRKADGEFFTAAGTYREVKPPERLVFTWAWEKDGSEADFGELEPDETLVTIDFLARGNDTLIVFTHERFARRAKSRPPSRRLDANSRWFPETFLNRRIAPHCPAIASERRRDAPPLSNGRRPFPDRSDPERIPDISPASLRWRDINIHRHGSTRMAAK